MKRFTQFIFVLFIFVVGVIIGRKIHINVSGTKIITFRENARDYKLKQVLKIIDQDYIVSVDADKIVNEVINYILSRLDPYSVYIKKEKQKSEREETLGYFDGIGIQYITIEDSLVISHVEPKGPAFGKLLLGDRILKINQIKLTHDSILDHTNKLTQSQGFKAAIRLKEIIEKEKLGYLFDVEVYRPDIHQIKRFDIEKQNIILSSINETHIKKTNTGYAKIERFTEKTPQELTKAINGLEEKGIKQLILDLRGNPGGLLESAYEVACLFLDYKNLVFYTLDKENRIKHYFTKSKGIFSQIPLCVLIDQNSASGSEIVAGALKDNKRALIVGRTSFGKGLIQEEKKLSDGSAIRISIAKCYTPLGHSIEGFMSEDKHQTEDMPVQHIKTSNQTDGLTTQGGIIPDVKVNHNEIELPKLFYNLGGYHALSFFTKIYYLKNPNLWDMQDAKLKTTKKQIDELINKLYKAYINSELKNVKLHFKQQKQIKKHIESSLLNMIGLQNDNNLMEDPFIEKAMELLKK